MLYSLLLIIMTQLYPEFQKKKMKKKKRKKGMSQRMYTDFVVRTQL